MSILSAQADALRDAAKRGGLVVGLPQMLDEAADTILELRDGLQRANTENAQLRQQLADVTESMGRVEERCAKLRELARKIEHYEREGCYECPYIEICDAKDLDDRSCEMSEEIGREKRELGVDE